MSGATVPLVYYNGEGKRIVIGEAKVNITSNGVEADCTVVDERFQDMLHPGLEVSLSPPVALLQEMLPESLEP